MWEFQAPTWVCVGGSWISETLWDLRVQTGPYSDNIGWGGGWERKGPDGESSVAKCTKVGPQSAGDIRWCIFTAGESISVSIGILLIRSFRRSVTGYIQSSEVKLRVGLYTFNYVKNLFYIYIYIFFNSSSQSQPLAIKEIGIHQTASFHFRNNNNDNTIKHILSLFCVRFCSESFTNMNSFISHNNHLKLEL